LEVAPGWINIDGSPNALVAQMPRWLHRLAYRFSGARLYHDEASYCSRLTCGRFVFHHLDYGIPINSNCVDYVYSSHFLEHLDRSAAFMLLKEIYRTLKLGGIVRIVVPDLEHAWKMYQSGQTERMLRDYFFVDHQAGFSKHRWAYDFKLLSEALTAAGFNHVARMALGEGAVPDIDVLDNRAEYSLFVEAIKDN
jgi:SAM-dependent methyltransferase